MQTVRELETTPELERELAEAEEKVTLHYTLADAIREGARQAPQVRGSYVTDEGACALGAAWLAIKAREYLD